jgi:hypothetical protein
MHMPEATVHENRDLSTLDRYIWATWEAADMNSESITKAV